jgi:phospholipase C
MEDDGSEPAAEANLAKVHHVVVLMLENRSFDHER